MRLLILAFLLPFISISQEKNKSKINDYLKKNFSVNPENFSVKSSVETNPNYDVYYIQQKLNGINIHNAVNSLTVKVDKINIVKNSFIDSSFLRSSPKEPLINFDSIKNIFGEAPIQTPPLPNTAMPVVQTARANVNPNTNLTRTQEALLSPEEKIIASRRII